MFERFTQGARDVVVDAQQQAMALGHREILAGHLLLGLLDVDGVGARILRGLGVQRDAVAAEMAALVNSDADALGSIGIDLDAVRRRAEAAFGPGALDRPRRRAGSLRSRLLGDHIPFTAAAKKALEQALREAQALRHSYIGTEHILLGLVADEHGPVAGTLRRLGVTQDADAVRAHVREELRRTA
jgi:ATP-dependent Clp protease ATP-binding subunit ClpA